MVLIADIEKLKGSLARVRTECYYLELRTLKILVGFDLPDVKRNL